MVTITGDSEALPQGWHLDDDNWGARPATVEERAAVRDLSKLVGRAHALRACIDEDGMLCVMDAATARAFDNRKA